MPPTLPTQMSGMRRKAVEEDSTKDTPMATIIRRR